MEQEVKRKVQIEIEENASEALVSIVENDIVVRRRVLLSVLSRLMDSSMRINETVQYQYIEPLPDICKGLMYSSRDTFRVAFDVPAAVRPFTFMNGSKEVLFEKIPFPRCAFVFDVVKGKVENSFCCAVNKSDEQCRFPFPNVYESCNICWGGNRIGTIDSVTKAVSCVRLFFESGFNTHLYYKSENVCIPDDPSIEELLRRLQNKAEFPDEWLISINRPVTDFFNSHLERGEQL